MRLEAVYFTNNTGHSIIGRYGRLARVLRATAQRYATNVNVREVPPPPAELYEIVGPNSLYPTKDQRGQYFVANLWKLRQWERIVAEAADGDEMLLVDADTFITGNLATLWEQPFDIAYTPQELRCRCTLSDWPPATAGVVALRVSDRTRRFFREWLEIAEALFVSDPSHQRWMLRGGIASASLCAMLETGGIERCQVAVARLPNRFWNCVADSWQNFSDRTRIVHVMGALRTAIFGLDRGEAQRRSQGTQKQWIDLAAASCPEVVRLAELWRSLAAELCPEERTLLESEAPYRAFPPYDVPPFEKEITTELGPEELARLVEFERRRREVTPPVALHDRAIWKPWWAGQES